MAGHHRIDYIEFTVTDPSRSRDFYGMAFGWEFNDYGPDYSGIRDDDGEAGGLARGNPQEAGPLPILYSEDLDSTLQSVRDAGGTITQEPYDFPGGRRFHFRDPDGNDLAVYTDVEENHNS
ncbi:MAG: VOC family protein [Acidimicrobiia bacterium]|nr:VOC family protein [Acidimicrobiia bacterium]